MCANNLPCADSYPLVSCELNRRAHISQMIGKKRVVPEEMRCDVRSIHRIAPPGLKGYMGAEYSNNFFSRSKDECEVPAAVPSAPRKTFAQKCAEEEHSLQVELVRTGLGSIPTASGDGEVDDSDDESEHLAEQPETQRALAD